MRLTADKHRPERVGEIPRVGLMRALTRDHSRVQKSGKLRLSLAKLYRAANRNADADAVLAPAVEGFPPTQQFPELTEAQILLAALNP